MWRRNMGGKGGESGMELRDEMVRIRKWTEARQAQSRSVHAYEIFLKP